MNVLTATREDRKMSNEIANYNPGQASLLEMRADATRFPRIKTLPREQAVSGLARIVGQAFLYRGQAADPVNVQFISNALLNELLQDDRFGASYLSLAEIQVVVKRAVLESDMFGISVSTLYKVIMAYVKGEGHLNQKQVDQSRSEAQDRAFKASPVYAMISAAAGNFSKNHKSK